MIVLSVDLSHVGAQSATVRVTGPRSLTLSSADLAAMPRTTIKTTVKDQTVTYEGVSVREILTRAGVPAGQALHGGELLTVIVVAAADGYRVAFSVAEFDPLYTDRQAILADRKDGAALSGNEAPFELILTGEKHLSRWVRQVTSIEVQKVR